MICCLFWNPLDRCSFIFPQDVKDEDDVQSKIAEEKDEAPKKSEATEKTDDVKPSESESTGEKLAEAGENQVREMNRKVDTGIPCESKRQMFSV